MPSPLLSFELGHRYVQVFESQAEDYNPGHYSGKLSFDPDCDVSPANDLSIPAEQKNRVMRILRAGKTLKE